MIVVVPGAVVGRTSTVPLEINKGGDLNFDILWWADEKRTVAMEISAASAQVRDNDGELILDLAPTFVDNRLLFRVPAAVTSAIAHRGHAQWDVEVTAALTGETKKLAKGPVRLFEEVSL